MAKCFPIVTITVGLLLGAGLTGCYSFSSTGASHIKTVAIPIFQDQTGEFGIKEELTEAVIEQFTRDNSLRVTERRGADSLIDGNVIRVRDEAGAFGSDESVQDIKVFVTVAVEYRDLKKRKLIWEEEVTQWGTFDPDEAGESRNSAITEAIEKLATDILNKSVSGW